MDEIVRVQNLCFRYAGGSSPALEGINFAIRRGQFVGITGPAGAGKTTLLGCINGVIPHYYSGELSGSVVVDGLEVARSTLRQLAGHIGTVFEDPDFQMVSITVEEEIAFGPENLGVGPDEIEQRIQEAMARTGIAGMRERAISTLSGGQRQRVAIAAVLSMMPQVILLDEPTSELDPIGTFEVFATLHDLNRRLGMTVILVSQQMEQLVEHADRILVLNRGRLAFDGPPQELWLRMAELEEIGVRTPEAAEFIISLLGRLNRPLSPDIVPLTTGSAIDILRAVLAERGLA